MICGFQMCICQVPEEPLPKEADTKAQWQFCFVAIQFVDIPLQVSLCPSELRKGGPNYCKLSDSHHLEVKYAERHTETRAYRWSQLPSLLRGF